MKNDLTQAELKTLLDYDPETGIFTWKVNRHRVKSGDYAGTIHRTGYRYLKINTVLKTYDGTSRHRHRWQSLPGEKNAKVYALLARNDSSADDYRRVKSGEY